MTIEGGSNAGSRVSNTPNGSWTVYFKVTSAGTDNVDIEQVCVGPPVGNTAPVGPPTSPTAPKVVRIG